MEGKEEFWAHDGCTSERTLRSGSTLKLWNVDLAIATENNRLISHNDECRERVESTMRDDAVGSGRFEESQRRKGEVAPGRARIKRDTKNGRRCRVYRVCKTLQRADLSSLHTVR